MIAAAKLAIVFGCTGTTVGAGTQLLPLFGNSTATVKQTPKTEDLTRQNLEQEKNLQAVQPQEVPLPSQSPNEVTAVSLPDPSSKVSGQEESKAPVKSEQTHSAPVGRVLLVSGGGTSTETNKDSLKPESPLTSVDSVKNPGGDVSTPSISGPKAVDPVTAVSESPKQENDVSVTTVSTTVSSSSEAQDSISQVAAPEPSLPAPEPLTVKVQQPETLNQPSTSPAEPVTSQVESRSDDSGTVSSELDSKAGVSGTEEKSLSEDSEDSSEEEDEDEEEDDDKVSEASSDQANQGGKEKSKKSKKVYKSRVGCNKQKNRCQTWLRRQSTRGQTPGNRIQVASSTRRT
ncbi:hypothetical protein MHLP_03120 [Candidatus Mycoplasma haematolamae str. Purdue]|uniref:Uncharacterized protein n=1 Tax=Mycoplasma haematolamae (strain Purdue) TaxID=1212765 RepID=I7CJZ9_MYCHA|nr:hypothetical protein [Candidatus Mycoplasma haematolamae]AFO52204.1 hypothetical protein MHLP_03120 [Candidatus Mycoplasma haematolamae str. Purdue]